MKDPRVAVADIRKELKSARIKAYVRLQKSALCTYEIIVRVVSGSIDEAMRISERYEDVRRDDTGEILGGMNTFVRVVKYYRSDVT